MRLTKLAVTRMKFINALCDSPLYYALLLFLMGLIIVFTITGLASHIAPYDPFGLKPFFNKPLSQATLGDAAGVLICVVSYYALIRGGR